MRRLIWIYVVCKSLLLSPVPVKELNGQCLLSAKPGILWNYSIRMIRIPMIRKSMARLPLTTKTRLYNFDPLKPHFYIVKLGFTGVYIIFHISAQNIHCGYSLEPPRLAQNIEAVLTNTHNVCFEHEAVLTCTHNVCFEQKCEKYKNYFYLKMFSF